MSIRCDNCGTRKHVKRAFITVWNGNVIDLCMKCARRLGLVKIIDKVARW